MSVQITTAFVEQFRSNVYHLTQQKGSRLRRAVRTESVVGRNAYFDQIGSTAARERLSRHSDTPRMDTPHSRRRVSMRDYDWADLIDEEDTIRMLINPASPYVDAASMAMGRSIDDTIVQAADGVAYTGVDGGTSTAFDTNMVVDVQVRWPGVSAADYGLNVAKIIEAARLLAANNVDADEEKWLVVNANQVSSLMKDARVGSHDYNTLKPLASGSIVSYHGFNILSTERIGNDSNGDNKVLYWAKGGMLLGLGRDISTDIGPRRDKNNATQVFASMSIGATRMEEVRVGYIECDPTAGPGA